MATQAEMKTDLDFHKAAKKSLQAAYIAIAEGGAQQYSIGSRSISKIDLPKIRAEIAEHDKKIAELESLMAGGSRRRAASVVIRDW